MSECESHQGRLVKFPKLDGEKVLDCVHRYIKEHNIVISQYAIDCTDVGELISDCLYNKLFLYKDEIYEICDFMMEDYEDLYVAKEVKEGEFEYVLRYYNGGCCLTEALEHALNKLKIKAKV
jgi:3-methyladenine DNA glycosylase AlkC